MCQVGESAYVALRLEEGLAAPWAFSPPHDILWNSEVVGSFSDLNTQRHRGHVSRE